MSDTILCIVPTNPAHVPDVGAQRSAGAQVRQAFPEADEVRIRVEDAVMFVDAGGNFDAVCCPVCAAVLAPAWWLDAMERAAAVGFAELAVTVPCCGAATGLNDLRYDMPQGFARFILEVRCANRADVPAAVAQLLQETLGCELRFAWAHI